MRILVSMPDGSACPIRETDLAPYAEVVETIAAAGETALFEWFIPTHRPSVEDVEIVNGVIVVSLFDPTQAQASA